MNGVAPGPIRTPLQVSGGATMDHLEHFGMDYPLGRAGQPAELASIHVQLADDQASHTTAISTAPATARGSLRADHGHVNAHCVHMPA